MDTPRFGPHSFPPRPNGSPGPGSNDSTPSPPSTAQVLTRRLVWSLVGAGLFVFTLYTLGFGSRWSSRHSAPSAPPSSKVADSDPVVQTITPRVALDEVQETLTGEVEPFEEAIVRVSSSGFLKWVAGKKGAVRQGELLAEIEKPGLEGDLAQGQADLEYARALLTEAQAKAELARSALPREKAQGELAVADAHVGVCRADVKVKETRLKQLTQQHASQKILAPLSGTVRQRSFADGAWIDAEGPNSRRELCRIGSLDVARVVLRVPNPVVSKLPPQTIVKLRTKGTRQTVEGRVVAVGAGDGQDRRVEVRVVNRDHILKPDSKVETTITYKPGTASVWVPAGAVLRAGNSARVQLVEDGAIHYRTVREGATNGPEIQILSGLRGSEVVVENANEDLVEGRIVNVEPAKDGRAEKLKNRK